MTEFDSALEEFQQNREDAKSQSRFYDLFLNGTFLVPTVGEEDGHAVPLVVEADGNDYLMLFDTEERLQRWAQAEVSFVEVPGHVLAEMSAPPLRWALNVGSEPSKEFLPDEIAWLREAVERCDAAGGEEC